MLLPSPIYIVQNIWCFPGFYFIILIFYLSCKISKSFKKNPGKRQVFQTTIHVYITHNFFHCFLNFRVMGVLHFLQIVFQLWVAALWKWIRLHGQNHRGKAGREGRHISWRKILIWYPVSIQHDSVKIVDYMILRFGTRTESFYIEKVE